MSPYGFVIADGRGKLSVLVDNYRTDSDKLWDDNVSEETLSTMPLNKVPPAAPDTTKLTFDYPAGTVRPTVRMKGAKAIQTWNGATAKLTVTFRHRGPVELTFS